MNSRVCWVSEGCSPSRRKLIQKELLAKKMATIQWSLNVYGLWVLDLSEFPGDWLWAWSAHASGIWKDALEGSPYWGVQEAGCQTKKLRVCPVEGGSSLTRSSAAAHSKVEAKALLAAPLQSLRVQHSYDHLQSSPWRTKQSDYNIKITHDTLKL